MNLDCAKAQVAARGHFNAGPVSIRGKLASLGIAVKVATGYNPRVAEKVCSDLGLVSGGTLTGTQIENLSDPELRAAARQTGIFARVSRDKRPGWSGCFAKTAWPLASLGTALTMRLPCTMPT